MPYLSANSISLAWSNLAKKSNVPNKFFGLIEMFKVFDIDVSHKIQAQEQYTFTSSRLSNALKELFSFETGRDFKGEEKYWVILAKDWQSVVYHDFLNAKPINILDVAIICYQNVEFIEDFSSDMVIEKFCDEYHLESSQKLPLFFNREDYSIEWQDSALDRNELKNSLMTTLGIEKDTISIGFDYPYPVTTNPGELTRAPFFQTLYSSQNALKCLICTKFDIFQQYNFDNMGEKQEFTPSQNLTPKQKIYFGSPGTGKSTALQNFATNNGLEVIRTTFHPDTDYYSFVGGYKPVMKGDLIVYQFIPQAFTRAYIQAYKHPEMNFLLAIEEINRGNCAQIFGDLFQCLDRNDSGESCYPIDTNTDMATYLASESIPHPEVLILPANLLIYATMNTSDQSLFPMDSAFKRRWDWEYVPIQFDEKAEKIQIVFDDDSRYSWRTFIEKVNEKITEATRSEDKKMGVYFISPDQNQVISLAQFKSKVMFYLWSEIFKNEYLSSESIFKYINTNGNEIDFTFNELFENEGLEKLKGFMKYLEIVPM